VWIVFAIDGMTTITQTTVMQPSGRDRPKPPPPPPPGTKPPPPPLSALKPSAVVEPYNKVSSESVGDKRSGPIQESERRKVVKSNTSDSTDAVWSPLSLRDVNSFQKKQQVGQGTYG
jgi:hypothetical protein